MQLALELKHQLIQRADHALARGPANMPRSHCGKLRLNGQRFQTKLMKHAGSRLNDALRQALDVPRHYNHRKQCPFADAQNQVAWPSD
jgi:hypothetical protein